jgi:hypothetical protein
MRHYTPHSSAIEWIEYSDKGTRVLFHSGHEYIYEGIGLDVVKEWLKAESVGKYYHKHIKQVYPSRWIPFNDWSME